MRKNFFLKMLLLALVAAWLLSFKIKGSSHLTLNFAVWGGTLLVLLLATKQKDRKYWRKTVSVTVPKLRKTSTADGWVKMATMGGMLSALTFGLQISYVFFPGPGYFISAFSTLPVAIAASLNPANGVFTLLVAAALVLFVQPVSTLILLFNTGLLGLIIGCGIYYGFAKRILVLFGALGLFTGIVTLTFIAGIEFSGMIAQQGLILANSFIFLFCLVYSSAWVFLIDMTCNRILKSIM
ncbi:hypothetical protein [Calderihabitans maritimus]|uniref:Uncharacterized protein n=1 Tax=Calderihabitans maritimus TaxID=1246530 RepID=A0A1Z5HNH8_9FIRM|nr:hypothetical protein [Calderihabitans maritimus]GAW91082.1 hypothetical protein KKC1_02440 [Calderihabitans maritimus]